MQGSKVLMTFSKPTGLPAFWLTIFVVLTQRRNGLFFPISVRSSVRFPVGY